MQEMGLHYEALDFWNSFSIFRVLFRKHFENIAYLFCRYRELFTRFSLEPNLVENIQRRETFVDGSKSTSLGNACVLKLSSPRNMREKKISIKDDVMEKQTPTSTETVNRPSGQVYNYIIKKLHAFEISRIVNCNVKKKDGIGKRERWRTRG